MITSVLLYVLAYGIASHHNTFTLLKDCNLSMLLCSQAKLADALIETCMRLKKVRKDAGEDVVDGIVGM